MVDISSAAAALNSLKSVAEIAKTLIGIHDTKAIDGKVRELNQKLIDAQFNIFAVNEERTTLIERIGTLEKELLDLETWDARKQCYELKRLAGGSFAYAIKQSMSGAEPAHCLCTNCYQDRVESILQPEVNPASALLLSATNELICPRCRTRFSD